MPGLTDDAQLPGPTLLAGRAQRDRAQMAMLDDRDRIARDMHDHVIQRLLATGDGGTGERSRVGRPGAAAQVPRDQGPGRPTSSLETMDTTQS